MWNTGMDKAQARIKIAGCNINNLRYADDTTLMAENEEELKSLLRNLFAVQEQNMDQKTGSTLGKEYVKAVYCHPHPAYRFLKRFVRWSGIPISFRIFHSLLWSTQSKALA